MKNQGIEVASHVTETANEIKKVFIGFLLNATTQLSNCHKSV
jgi:hypothetical protein